MLVDFKVNNTFSKTWSFTQGRISFDNSISIIEEEPETPIGIPNLLLQLNEIK